MVRRSGESCIVRARIGGARHVLFAFPPMGAYRLPEWFFQLLLSDDIVQAALRLLNAAADCDWWRGAASDADEADRAPLAA